MTSVLVLTLAYDGTDFHGWARQRDPTIRTIEGSLTELLQVIVQEPVKLSVAGRTDAGVHARGQVASFRTTAAVEPERLRRAVNRRLAPEIVVIDAAQASDGFDARFSATARGYRYRIDERDPPDPFVARFVWNRPGRFEVSPMRAAAGALVGEHDFASFCRHPGADRSTVRDLTALTIARRAGLLEIRVVANAFLHQMVRSLVGTLVDVGEGRLDPGSMSDILAARDRSVAGRLAPARGLTLERVRYGRRGGARSL